MSGWLTADCRLACPRFALVCCLVAVFCCVKSFQGTISLNAAIFAAVLLASRLHDYDSSAAVPLERGADGAADVCARGWHQLAELRPELHPRHPSHASHLARLARLFGLQAHHNCALPIALPLPLSGLSHLSTTLQLTTPQPQLQPQSPQLALGHVGAAPGSGSDCDCDGDSDSDCDSGHSEDVGAGGACSAETDASGDCGEGVVCTSPGVHGSPGPRGSYDGDAPSLCDGHTRGGVATAPYSRGREHSGLSPAPAPANAMDAAVPERSSCGPAQPSAHRTVWGTADEAADVVADPALALVLREALLHIYYADGSLAVFALIFFAFEIFAGFPLVALRIRRHSLRWHVWTTAALALITFVFLFLVFKVLFSSRVILCMLVSFVVVPLCCRLVLVVRAHWSGWLRSADCTAPIPSCQRALMSGGLLFAVFPRTRVSFCCVFACVRSILVCLRTRSVLLFAFDDRSCLLFYTWALLFSSLSYAPFGCNGSSGSKSELFCLVSCYATHRTALFRSAVPCAGGC